MHLKLYNCLLSYPFGKIIQKTKEYLQMNNLQTITQISIDSISLITPDILESYISTLHITYKPKTVKRKIASIKAFFHYLEYNEDVVSFLQTYKYEYLEEIQDCGYFFVNNFSRRLSAMDSSIKR